MTKHDKSVDWVGVAKDKELSGLSIRSYYRSGRLQTFVTSSMQTLLRRVRHLREQSGSSALSTAAAADRAIPVYSFTEQQVQSVLGVRNNDTPKRTGAAGGRYQVRVRLPRDIAIEIDCDNPERLLLKTLLLVLP